MTGLKGGTGNAIVAYSNFGTDPSRKGSWNDNQNPLNQYDYESKYQGYDEWTAQFFDDWDGSLADRLEVDRLEVLLARTGLRPGPAADF